MGKVRFQIGKEDFLQVSLPSRYEGDGSVLVGKARLRLASVAASQRIWIDGNDLTRLLDDVQAAYDTLKGEFELVSTHEEFAMHGTMTHKGHVRIRVRMSGRGFHIAADSTWIVEGDFTCEPDELKRVLSIKV